MDADKISKLSARLTRAAYRNLRPVLTELLFEFTAQSERMEVIDSDDELFIEEDYPFDLTFDQEGEVEDDIGSFLDENEEYILTSIQDGIERHLTKVSNNVRRKERI